jgi:hypothetical protein
MTETAQRSAVNIRPGVGIIGLFPYMNYKPWFALGELVDNALGSFLKNRERLEQLDGSYQCRIEIEVSTVAGGYIRVADNAGGIAEADYDRAFVAAEPPPDGTGLSQFGVGMKSASCWFARQWEVRTSALGEDVERTIRFDVPKIVENGIEEVVVDERPVPAEAHYTEVVLTNLNKLPQPRTIQKMAEHLASMYRKFLERGDVDIRFNGQPLVFTQPRVLVAKSYDDLDGAPVEWRKEIDFVLPTGERVTGFAGIRETGSASKAGLALFRRQRLIVGSDDDSYRPAEIFGASNKFRYQRVFGELNLDDFDVSYSKDGFIWEDREQTFIELLKAQLDDESMPLLRQAEHHRARTPSPNQRLAGTKALESTVRAVEGIGDHLDDQITAKPDSAPLPFEQPPASDLEQRSLRVWVGGKAWDISIELTADPAVGQWVSVASTSPASDHSRRLEIRVSLAHPFMLQYGGTTADDLEPLLRVAAGLALAEVTAREAGVRMAGTVLRNLNDLLRGSLAQP